jgi:hypothetical protein
MAGLQNCSCRAPLLFEHVVASAPGHDAFESELVGSTHGGDLKDRAWPGERCTIYGEVDGELAIAVDRIHEDWDEP